VVAEDPGVEEVLIHGWREDHMVEDTEVAGEAATVVDMEMTLEVVTVEDMVNGAGVTLVPTMEVDMAVVQCEVVAVGTTVGVVHMGRTIDLV